MISNSEKLNTANHLLPISKTSQLCRNLLLCNGLFCTRICVCIYIDSVVGSRGEHVGESVGTVGRFGIRQCSPPSSVGNYVPGFRHP